MVSTDPIADMFSRLRNAIAVGKDQVNLPHSNTKETVAKILANNGFLNDVSIDSTGQRKQLSISIYNQGDNAKITEISRISRPGRRVYVKADAIPVVKRGRGIVVISTSKGVMTGSEARAQRLGGELICQVY